MKYQWKTNKLVINFWEPNTTLNLWKIIIKQSEQNGYMHIHSSVKRTALQLSGSEVSCAPFIFKKCKKWEKNFSTPLKMVKSRWQWNVKSLFMRKCFRMEIYYNTVLNRLLWQTVLIIDDRVITKSIKQSIMRALVYIHIWVGIHKNESTISIMK